MAFGRGKAAANPRHAAPTAPGSSACMGEPCEMNIEGSIDRLTPIGESLFSQKIPFEIAATSLLATKPERRTIFQVTGYFDEREIRDFSPISIIAQNGLVLVANFEARCNRADAVAAYSCGMFAAFIIAPHFSISSALYFANPSGVPGMGS